MSVPKFVLLYFPDSDLVKVDCTDIIRTEHRRLEYQVSSREELHSEDGFVEVCLPSRSRNGPTTILAAKILLFCDVYKDLVVKRDAFKKGEDIWNQNPHRLQKTAEAVKITSVSQKKAAVAIGEQLKRDLQTKHRKPTTHLTSTPMSDDSDNTAVDLFENTEHRQSKKRSWVLDSDDQDDLDDHRSLLQRTPPQSILVQLDEDAAKALKELPGIVASLKDVFEAMKRGSSCSSNSSTSSSELCIPGCSEMICLGDSEVSVPKKMLERLNKSRVSIFTQDLATLVFGKKTQAKSTLTGKSSGQTGKNQLDPLKVNAVIDTVIKEFPKTTVSEVRALIRRKCNNESYSKHTDHTPEV